MNNVKPPMNLREGKTVLFTMVNGGFMREAMAIITEWLPNLVAVCGDKLYVAVGASSVSQLYHHSTITTALAQSDDALYNLFKDVPQFNGGTNVNEVLKEMVQYHDYQDVDNLIFMGSCMDTFLIDIRTRLWIARRNFVVVALDDFIDSNEAYFKTIEHTLFGGKIYTIAHLMFMLQFEQLDK